MVSKRHNGQGTVYEDKTRGKWVAQLRAVDPKTGRMRAVGKRVRDTRGEAEQALAQLVADLEAEDVATVHYRVGDMVDDWVASKTGWAPATRARHLHRLAHLEPLRAHFVDQVTADDLEARFRQLAADGVSADDVRRVRQDFGNAFDRAVKRDRGRDRRNPAHLSDLPAESTHQPGRVREGRALTAFEAPSRCGSQRRWDRSPTTRRADRR